MKDTMRTEETDGEKSNEPSMRQTLVLAAAAAMLGLSLGVNVEELLASGPGEMQQADQSKLGGIHSKESAVLSKVPTIQDNRVGTQPKLPTMQQKQPMMPGVKPVDPPR
jgi:hypothetical protein